MTYEQFVTQWWFENIIGFLTYETCLTKYSMWNSFRKTGRYPHTSSSREPTRPNTTPLENHFPDFTTQAHPTFHSTSRARGTCWKDARAAERRSLSDMYESERVILINYWYLFVFIRICNRNTQWPKLKRIGIRTKIPFLFIANRYLCKSWHGLMCR